MLAKVAAHLSRPVPRAKAWAAILVTWTSLLGALDAFLDQTDTRVLLPALLACVGVLGIWRPVRFAGLLAGALSGVAYALLVFMQHPTNLVALVAVGAVSCLGLGLLTEGAARLVEGEDRQRRQDELLLDRLTTTEAETGALKWRQALQVLGEEIARARRHRYAVVLVFVEISTPDEDIVAPPGSEPPVSRLARLIMARLRQSDRVARYLSGEIVLILPHTGLEGALRTFEKLRVGSQDELRLDLRAGLVEFPTDAATSEDLVKEAYAALDSARALDIPVASRVLLAAP